MSLLNGEELDIWILEKCLDKRTGPNIGTGSITRKIRIFGDESTAVDHMSWEHHCTL